MSYLVLARRWRPQTFEDLIGQEHVGQTLQNALKNQRIAHAYLFSGSRGVGKTSTARLLAKALNCQNGPTPHPCNSCVHCRSITEGNSLDVIEIDGASNRGIEEIRELREGIRYLPSQTRYKVIIIDEVHMLTKEAFNALLKTLEEPPSHVVFIFATTEVNKIPITILSRCQHFPFRLIAIDRIVKRLGMLLESEQDKLSYGCLYQIARQAGGSMRDAESLLDQVLALEPTEISEKEILSLLGLVPREICYLFVRNLIARNTPFLLDTIKTLAIQGIDFRAFVRDLIECLRNALIITTVKEPGIILELPLEELSRLEELARTSSFEELFRLTKVISELEPQLKESSSERFALELACLRIAEMPPLKSINHLITRLEEFLADKSVQSIAQEPPAQFKKEKLPDLIMEPTMKPMLAPVEEEEDKPETSISQTVQEKVVIVSKLQEDWQAIIEKVKEKSNGSLESVLRQTEAASLEGDVLVVNFTTCNSFFLDTFNENKRHISEAASNVLGRTVKVELHSDFLHFAKKKERKPRQSESFPGQPVKRQEETSVHKIRNDAQRIKSSLVQDALEIFGGDIVIP